MLELAPGIGSGPALALVLLCWPLVSASLDLWRKRLRAAESAADGTPDPAKAGKP